MIPEAFRVLASDFDTCFDFYTNKLGLKPVWGEPGGVYASFDTGHGYSIGLFCSELMSAALGNFELEQPVQAREKIMVVLSTDSVDNVHEELSAKGLEFVMGPTNMTDWGMRVIYLRDPEGNLIEYYSPLV